MWLLLFLNFQMNEIQKDPQNGWIRFEAIVQPQHFNSVTSHTHNHHFIGWTRGKSASNTPILSIPSDLDILKALEEIGATSGNNLTAEAWTQRHNPQNPEPDKLVEGTPVEVIISWADQSITPQDLFTDKGQKGFEFRVGGHESLASLWQSGCVVCLESCPGARVSNRRYSMRDLAKRRAMFTLDTSKLPKRGERVTVTIKLLQTQDK